MDCRNLFIGMRVLSLTAVQLKQMIAHVDSQLPLEACGLLAGHGSSVASVLMVTNQAQSPVRFVMDPIEQLKAFEWINSQGLELVGIFHSHPAGPETVSLTDIADCAYAAANVILAHADGKWRARAFWIEGDNYEEIALQIE